MIVMSLCVSMDESRPWCAPMARSEPRFARQIIKAQANKVRALKKENTAR